MIREAGQWGSYGEGNGRKREGEEEEKRVSIRDQSQVVVFDYGRTYVASRHHNSHSSHSAAQPPLASASQELNLRSSALCGCSTKTTQDGTGPAAGFGEKSNYAAMRASIRSSATT